MTRLDAKGAALTSPSTIMPAFQCDWRPVTLLADVPNQVGNNGVKSIRFGVFLRGFEPGDEVYVDDMTVYRIGDIEELVE